MPLPTRRAVRPDGKHYRDSRRQRQMRSNRRIGGKRGLWMALAAIFMVGLFFATTLLMHQSQQRTWDWVACLGSVVGIVICVIASLLTSR